MPGQQAPWESETTELPELKERRNRKRGTGMKGRGFTLVEIMIVVFVLGILLAIGIPNFLQARVETHKNLCINNLRIIEAAKEQWALAHNRTQGEPVDEVGVNALLKSGAPHCPAGGDYTYGEVGATPRCSLGTTHAHTLSDIQPLKNSEDGDSKAEESGGPDEGKGRGRWNGRGNGRGGNGNFFHSATPEVRAKSGRPANLRNLRRAI